MHDIIFSKISIYATQNWNRFHLKMKSCVDNEQVSITLKLYLHET